MSVPNGANIPGNTGNYNTSHGGGLGGIWDWGKGLFGGTEVEFGSGGGKISQTYGGVKVTYNWGTGKWHADDPAAGESAGIPKAGLDLGPPPQQAGFSPQFFMYAVVGAVLLYFMVRK